MLCSQDPNMLGAYLDGELATDKERAIQQHLPNCATCAARVAELVSLRRRLIPARTRFAPSSEFRRKIQQQVAVRKKRSVFFRMPPVAIPLAAMLLLTIGWMQYTLRAGSFSEVADLHVNALASSNTLDVVSTDRHTVKPWFQGKIPFSFNVPEFAGTDFKLLGGRLVYLHQQPGAHLIIEMGKHKISVLIFQQSAELTRAVPLFDGVRNRNSFRLETWQAQGLRFFIVGDTDASEIDKLGRALKQAND